jgi:SPP1 gp7 family putative phage head morphogenesis protein
MSRLYDYGIDDQRLEMDEAIDYFAQKTNLDTDTWKDGQGIVQLANFTVAGTKAALLQDIHDTLDRAISAGESMQQFMDRFAKVTDRWVGKSAWRAQLIYDQNIRQAYGMGRQQQMRETVADRPYWQWRHGGSGDPRPEHLAMDGKIFKAEDVVVFPPAGFGCTCQIFSLSDRDLDRSGGKLSVFSLEPDPGFLYRGGIDKKIDQMKVDQVLKDFMRGELLISS